MFGITIHTDTFTDRKGRERKVIRTVGRGRISHLSIRGETVTDGVRHVAIATDYRNA